MWGKSSITLFSVISMTVWPRSSSGVASMNSCTELSPCESEKRSMGSMLMKRRYSAGRAALLLDAAGGALDGFEQGALEAHLGRLPEARVAHVEVDVRQVLALQLLLEEVEQLFLEAALDEAQVVFVHEAVVARRGEDDEDFVSISSLG